MKRILVVDDEVAITEGLTALFTIEQVEADGAFDRETAEEMIAREFYPVILADLRLKTEADGLALLEAIRELSPRSRVASLTAFATPAIERELIERGSTMVLRKPMGFDEIISIVLGMLAEFDEELEQIEGAPEVDVEAMYGQLHRLLVSIPQRRYGLTREESEELVQEAWLLYLQKKSSVRMAKAWLAGTMLNLSRQQIHRNMRMRDTDVAIDPEVAAKLSVGTGGIEAMVVMGQGFDQLDERARSLCSLIGIEGRSYEEVSHALDLPIGSVGPLYLRAKQRLKQALSN